MPANRWVVESYSGAETTPARKGTSQFTESTNVNLRSGTGAQMYRVLVLSRIARVIGRPFVRPAYHW